MNDVWTVGAHMTPAPHVIAVDATLAEAQRCMREYATQLLPVVDRGQPRGVLLERDLHVARKLGAALDVVTVGAVLPGASFSVKSGEHLVTALHAMAARAATHIVVTDETRICGVLATHDVLRLLAELLEQRDIEAGRTGAAREASAGPGMSGHGDVQSAGWSSEQSGCSLLDEAYLLERVEERAAQLMRDAQGRPEELREAVRELHDAQATLLASERRELAETRPDEEPLHRTRLEQLSDERARHVQAFASLLIELDRGTKATSSIAGHALQAAAALRTHIEREREPLRFVS